MNAERPTVWVTQETAHNFIPAEQYGDIEFITDRDFNNIKSSLNNEALLSSISFKLKKFNPSDDYIVIAGSPYVSAAVFMVLGYKKIQAVKLLRWDNRDFIYRPMYIDFRKEEMIDNG